MNGKKLLHSLIKVGLPLLLGGGLLWMLYRDMDSPSIVQVMRRGMRYDIILFSLLFGLAGNIIRACRWGLLIDSLGDRCKTKNLIYAVLGNYAINFLLPRAGELWRCGVIAKYEKIPFSKLFGTLLIDRMSDTLAVAAIALCLLIFNFTFFERFLTANPNLFLAFPNEWLLIGALLLIAAAWLTLTRLTHLAFIQKVRHFLRNVWEGMKSIRLMKRKRLFLLHTLLLWTAYFLFFYITFFAFPFTRPLSVGTALIVFTLASIAIGLPVQGGIGVWHFTVIAAMTRFGVNNSDAAAFALVVHTLQSLWQILCGLFAICALPLANRTTT